MLSDRCLSCPVLSVCPVCPVCLFVTLIYCGQTVGWINLKLGIQVVIGLGHIVLAGDPAPIPQKGAEPPIFGQYLLWLNGWMLPLLQIGAEPSPIFGPYLLWSNGSMHQDATW